MKACYALLLLLCVGMLVTKTLTACQRHDTHATHTSQGGGGVVIILIFPEKLAQPSRHTHHLMDSTFSSLPAIYSNQTYASMCSRTRPANATFLENPDDICTLSAGHNEKGVTIA
uniref:Putative secreted protein n=1 Tax=Anopheles darlingi TaxID=43151 RepID=A0A2M4D596_ANODA